MSYRHSCEACVWCVRRVDVESLWAVGEEARFSSSSRRRHTRYWRDWSSDVCSSDLMIRHTRYWRDWSSDVCSSDLSRITTTLRSLTRTPTTLTTCTDVSSTVTESG